MTKKEKARQEQEKENKCVLAEANRICDYDPYFNKFYPKEYPYKSRPFRKCSATVHYNSDGVFLKSYDTYIAFIPTGKKFCVDFLRYVYGFTATSSQHIRKFAEDFGADYILSWK